MSTSGLFFCLLLLISKILSEFEICDENNENVIIRHSIAFNKSLHLFTLNKDQIDHYIIDHFEWDGDSVNLSKIRKTKPGWFIFEEKRVALEWLLPQVILTFMVDYPGLSLWPFSIADMEEKGLKGWLWTDMKLLEVKSVPNITLKRDPNECKSDPLMLCSIFGYFPESNTQNETENFLAFVSFPPSIDGLPFRYLVYYRNETNNYRYLFMKERFSEDGKNLTFIADNTLDDQSIDLKGIVNSATAISDYKKNESVHYFDLIEFSGKWFEIHRVYITPEKVTMELIKKGTFGPLLCSGNSTVTDEPKGPTPPVETTPEDKGTSMTTTIGPKTSFPFWVIIVVIAVILVLIALVIVAFICCNRKQTPTKSKETTPAKTPAPPPIPPPKASSTGPGIEKSKSLETVRSGFTDSNVGKAKTTKSNSTSNTGSTKLSQTST